eukprot:4487286-Ditylum_brightwellii.AAC.1
MINNDQKLDKLADGKIKDSVVTTSGKEQQHQQQSNVTNQISLLYKPLYPTVPAPVPITAHVISEHLAPHPQGQHPGHSTKTTSIFSIPYMHRAYKFSIHVTLLEDEMRPLMAE